MSILYNGSCYFQTPISGPNCEASKTVIFRLFLTTGATAVQAFYNATDTVAVAYQLGMRLGLFTVWNFGGGVIVSYTPTLSTWITVAYTYDSLTGTSTIYEDGVLKATSTTAVQTGAVNVTQIGGNQWGEYSTSASLEDLRVYDRVLTVNELLDISAANGKDFNDYGLVNWWRMTEDLSGVTMTATDLKENRGAVSTLVGTAPFPISQQSGLQLRPIP